jgi:Zn finger protein HypA/HybF involved in hydrogenase expression
VDRKEACCPKCKSQAIRMTAGREFYVESLNVE